MHDSARKCHTSCLVKKKYRQQNTASEWAKKISKLNKRGDDKEIRVLLIGIDGAGKTTIFKRFTDSDDDAAESSNSAESGVYTPTIGYSVESIKYESSVINLWDVGGREQLRHLWSAYFTNTQVVIFVLDSTCKDRVDEARRELHSMLTNDSLHSAIFLVLANKQDLPNTMTMDEIKDKLDLTSLIKRKWKIQPCCALTGEGLLEGLDWIIKNVNAKSSSTK